jgi:taurine--2-oxoglutarate transaminase
MTTPINDPEKQAAVSAADHKYVFHSWSAQGAISPMPIASGSGSRFWDHAGKVYLDFSSQLVFTNIGHQHPKVIKAIQTQAEVLTTIAPQHANEARNEAAQRIVELAGSNFAKL